MSLKDTVLKYTQENNIKKEYSQDEKIKLIQKELEKFTDDFWEEQISKLKEFATDENSNKYCELYIKRLILKRDYYQEILKEPRLVDYKIQELKEKLNKISADMKKLEVDILKIKQTLL